MTTRTHVAVPNVDGPQINLEIVETAPGSGIYMLVVTEPAGGGSGATGNVSDATTHATLTQIANVLGATLGVSDPATHTTLAQIEATLTGTLGVADANARATLVSILNKLIAAPATEAKQDTMNTALAAILAKLIAAPSTEAKQDVGNTTLGNVLLALAALTSGNQKTQTWDAAKGVAQSLFAYPDGIGGVIAGTTRTLFSDDFGGTTLDTVSRWDVYDGGLPAETVNGAPQAAIGTGITGITHNVAASIFNIVMGTTANAEKWFLSKQTFAGSEDLTVILSRSQSLTANSLFVGLVEVDPVTGYPILNPNLAQDFNNRGGLEFGKTASGQQCQVETVADGSPAMTALANNSFAPAAMTTAFESIIEFNAEDIWASAVAIDNINAKSGNAIRVSSQVPNDQKVYKLLIRARNIGAPASTTTFAISRIVLVDGVEARTEVKSGRGDNVAGKALAVNVQAGSALVGSVVPVQTASNASGGTQSTHRLSSAATTNATLVKNAAGRIYGGQLYNTSASARFFKMYNKATAPVPGTDTPFFTIFLPPATVVNILEVVGMMGEYFGTGIGYAITSAFSDTDTTTIAAGDVLVNILYS